MKEFSTILVFLFSYFSCFGQQNEQSASRFYGEDFEVMRLVETEEVMQRFATISISDSLDLQFKAKVKEVCKVKGCWMVIELTEGEQAMVRFKDYGFFMPSDILDKEVVLNGLGFVEEMSVGDQQHYAKDAGKTANEIANIKAPQRTYGFIASGVLVPN